MMELEFIPLKTPEGATCGFARVNGGYAELHLREPMAGQAAVLTESGVAEGMPGSRIAVQGARVQAIAVHTDGRIRCLGLARGASIGPEQVRARLMTTRRPAAPAGTDARHAAPQEHVAQDRATTAHTMPEPGDGARAAQLPVTPQPPAGAGQAPRPGTLLRSHAAAEAQREASAAHSVQARPVERPGAPLEGGGGEARAPSAPAAPAMAAPADGREPALPSDRAVLPSSAQSTAAPSASAPSWAHMPAPAAQGSAPGPEPSVADTLPPPPVVPYERPVHTAQTPAPGPVQEPAPGRMPEAAPERIAAQAVSAGAPNAMADSPDGPASIEQSAADSESFMALLRRADAAFLKLSERRSPAAGVVPAGGGTAQHRRSTRYESLRPDAAPADEPPRAEAGRAAPRAQEGPEAPPDAHPAADSAAPAMARSSAGPARATDHPSPHAHRFADGTSHWSEEIDRLLEDRSDAEQREPIANPFPNIFPGARFQRVSRPGAAMHLEGDWQRGGERLRITAVPGAYSPHPPAHLRDFTRYIRARSGGYWIRLTAY